MTRLFLSFLVIGLLCFAACKKDSASQGTSELIKGKWREISSSRVLVTEQGKVVNAFSSKASSNDYALFADTVIYSYFDDPNSSGPQFDTVFYHVFDNNHMVVSQSSTSAHVDTLTVDLSGDALKISSKTYRPGIDSFPALTSYDTTVFTRWK